MKSNRSNQVSPKTRSSLGRLMDLARWTPFVAAVIVLLYALLATGLVNVQARRSLMAAQNTAVLGLGYPPYHMGPVTDITYSGPDSAGMLQVNLFSHILHDQEAGTLVMDEIRPYEDGLVSGWYYAFDGDLFSFETGGLWACWVDTTFPVFAVRASTAVLAAMAALASLAVRHACRQARGALAGERDRARHAFSRASHSMKAPLAVIQGYADGLEDGVVNRDEAVAAISDEVRRATAMANQVLQKALVEEGAVGPDLNRRKVCDLLDAVAPHLEGVRIEQKSVPDEATAICDEDYIIALFNILEGGGCSSVVASWEGGALSLAAALDDTATMPEGYGLGLDLAALLVEQQGGAFDVSKEDGRVRVKITLCP